MSQEPVDFKAILEGLGYRLIDRGKEWRARPIFRDSTNDSALRIRKDDGRWIDFALGTGGDFKKLVELSGGKFDGKILPTREKKESIVQTDEVFDKRDIESIVHDHTYWINRGISQQTLELFQGGVIPKNTTSAMYNRYVFPIPNNRAEFVGISGRWLYPKIPKDVPKWKHLGLTESWVYPAFLNKQHILDKREIVLVESIGDGLALWEAGVKHFLVLFGLRCSRAMTKSLIAADPERIIVSTNNDSNKMGNTAAKKIAFQLKEYFDPSQISIKLPEKNDWGMTPREDIIKAFNEK